jgi:L-amino acid N-acyltransferase YncA
MPIGAWCDFSVYVAREARGRGAGRTAMEALASEARAQGFWKLVGRIFPENEASLTLCRKLGFREVGVYRRHARLGGAWRDVVVVELLLQD